MDINSSRGMSHGATFEQLQAVARFRDSALFGEAERVALAFAEAVTATPTAVTDTVFEPLRRHFSVPQIVELAVSISFGNTALMTFSMQNFSISACSASAAC